MKQCVKLCVVCSGPNCSSKMCVRTLGACVSNCIRQWLTIPNTAQDARHCVVWFCASCWSGNWVSISKRSPTSPTRSQTKDGGEQKTTQGPDAFPLGIPMCWRVRCALRLGAQRKLSGCFAPWIFKCHYKYKWNVEVVKATTTHRVHENNLLMQCWCAYRTCYVCMVDLVWLQATGSAMGRNDMFIFKCFDPLNIMLYTLPFLRHVDLCMAFFYYYALAFRNVL